MFGLFLLPTGQTFVLGGVHLYVTRILIAAGLARSVSLRWSQGHLLGFGYTSLDKIVTVWSIYRAVAFLLVFRQQGAVVKSAWISLGRLWWVLFDENANLK